MGVVSSPIRMQQGATSHCPQRAPKAGVHGASLLLGRQVSSWDLGKIQSEKGFGELVKNKIKMLSEVGSENHGYSGGD